MKIIKVNINEERKQIIDSITIKPITDTHIGDDNCNLKALKKALQEIKEEINTYTILNGDLINNTTKNSVGDVYIEKMTPTEQIIMLVELLKPIKDKILVINSGNHENRTCKESGVDIVKLVARELGIEDRCVNGMWYLYLYLGQKIDGRKAPMVYTITGYHGSGSGRKVGSKANRLEEMSQIVIADLYIMGHTHKPLSTKGIIYIPDYSNKSLTKKELYYLMTNSFVEYGGYAENFGLVPSNTTMTSAELNGKVRQIKLTI